ncbi:hypothetical protein ACIBBD_34620 [Streptomyces sp. NPDC051315]|uniref:hypothetical protein n=1 Tax=Streptomyces sp. NPDC051315 TaxID=3365650 RepID=UPI00378A347A
MSLLIGGLASFISITSVCRRVSEAFVDLAARDCWGEMTALLSRQVIVVGCLLGEARG